MKFHDNQGIELTLKGVGLMKCMICNQDMPFDCTCPDMGKRIQLVRDAKHMAVSEECFKEFSRRKLSIDIV